MKELKRFFIFLCAIIVLTSLTVSAPPTFQAEAPTGLVVEVPILEYLKANQTFKFHAHVYNQSNGVLFLNTDVTYCAIHIYTPTNGGHLIEQNMSLDSNGIDFDITVLGGNFSEVGQYAILIYCEVQEDVFTRGGFIEYPLMVTKTGTGLHTAEAILYVFLLIGSVVLFLFLFYWMMELKFGNFFDYETGALVGKNDWKYVKMFLIPVNYVLLMWIFGLTRSIAANYLALPGLELVFNWAFWIMLSLALPLLILTLWFLFISIINDKKITDALERGSPLNGP